MVFAQGNYRAVGIAKVLPPKGDSHYKFTIPGKRAWTLSVNDDPVPARYLDELCHLVGYPLSVVRHALLTGSLPRKRLRFDRYVH